MDETPHERARKAFEQGAFTENGTEGETSSRAELEANEREITEIERDMSAPTGSETENPLQVDQASESGFRETGRARESEEDAEERALLEIYDSVGYDADSEGFLDYPVALTGEITEIDYESGNMLVSYRINQEETGKLREPVAIEEEVLGTRLTPTENIAVEVNTGEEYLEIDLLYGEENLVEGSREAAEKLEEVEEHLSA